MLQVYLKGKIWEHEIRFKNLLKTTLFHYRYIHEKRKTVQKAKALSFLLPFQKQLTTISQVIWIFHKTEY